MWNRDSPVRVVSLQFLQIAWVGTTFLSKTQKYCSLEVTKLGKPKELAFLSFGLCSLDWRQKDRDRENSSVSDQVCIPLMLGSFCLNQPSHTKSCISTPPPPPLQPAEGYPFSSSYHQVVGVGFSQGCRSRGAGVQAEFMGNHRSTLIS